MMHTQVYIHIDENHISTPMDTGTLPFDEVVSRRLPVSGDRTRMGRRPSYHPGYRQYEEPRLVGDH